jgi:hypothetical protein
MYNQNPLTHKQGFFIWLCSTSVEFIVLLSFKSSETIFLQRQAGKEKERQMGQKDLPSSP